jgi:hypothetical protein
MLAPPAPRFIAPPIAADRSRQCPGELFRLGRVDEPEPEARGGELDESEIAPGGLLVARGDGTGPLQPGHQPLDATPKAVEVAVERYRLLVDRLRRDYREHTAHQQVLPPPVGIVAHVAD